MNKKNSCYIPVAKPILSKNVKNIFCIPASALYNTRLAKHKACVVLRAFLKPYCVFCRCWSIVFAILLWIMAAMILYVEFSREIGLKFPNCLSLLFEN